MKDYSVRQYETEDYAIWNAFISDAKNATFLFHRDFMEYHKDRFKDFSLLVFEEEKLVAVLPANRVENQVYSHQGLTYGGFIFSKKMKLSFALAVFKKVLQFLEEHKIKTLQLKLIPPFYTSHFSDEIKYALFLAEAKLIRRDSLSVIDLKTPYFISKTRKESIRRGMKNGLIIKEELQFDLFWNEILIPNLERKHQVKPVHTVEEITKLHQKFPQNIRHFNVYDQDKIVAGTTVFITDKVAHPQYVSGNQDKNELGSLDYLYFHLISEVFNDKDCFDFGISNENQGRKLNNGLCFWKESFGAHTVVQDFYEVATSNAHLLENVLL